MSSIYKKGRDGYYYYQKYVYNPKTGKKDKRVFHSLGTKDYETACIKKSEIDQSYKIEKHRGNGKIRYVFKYPKLVLASSAVLLTYIYYSSHQPKSIPDLKTLNTMEKYAENSLITSSDSLMISIVNTDEHGSENKTPTELQPYEMESMDSVGSVTQTKSLALPNFNIERFEELSGAFKQAKIYVTVGSVDQEKSLELLCDRIKNENSRFSNIIICFYKDNQTGKKLATGNSVGLNNQQKQEAWIGMYTYNPVEGAYFDNNPGGYLGSY